MAITVGHHGTVRVRHPLFGWESESPGTSENLHAVVWARLVSNSGTALEIAPGAVRDPIIAVGAHGVATVSGSGREASWRLEDTGTTQDLVSVAHFGAFTVAVGTAGTMVERSGNGVWRTVDTHTTADLASVGWLKGRIGAVGAHGTIVDCARLEERLVCIPRPSPVDADLVAVSSVIFGRGVRLRAIGSPPVEWQVVPDSDAPWFRNEDILATSDDIAVGRDGLVLLLSRAFGVAQFGEQPPGRIELPFGVDLHGVVFDGIQGYAVGDNGTIVHVGVHGRYEQAFCLE
jgi:hypothetical protein